MANRRALLPAVLALAAVAAGATALLIQPTRPATAPTPVPASASAGAGLAGQAVLTVPAALAWHAAHPDAAGTLVVSGWFGTEMTTGGPYPGVIDTLEYFYPLEWLMAGPETLTQSSGNGSFSHSPTGPALTLKDLGGTGFGIGVMGGPVAQPPALTLAGHFDDPEAILCQPDARANCRDAFVIDAAFDGDGRLVPPLQATDSAPGRMTPDEARAAAVAIHPDRVALATTFTADPTTPAQADAGDVRLLAEPWPGTGTHGWLVRLVVPGGDATPLTVFVDDATGAAHDLPAWPNWSEPPAPGLAGADPVAVATAAQAACDGATLGGGIFVRDAPGGDLYLINPYYRTRQRVLADPSRHLFVRGMGFDTVVIDANGTPLPSGTIRWATGCQGQEPNAAFVFRAIGQP